MGVGCGEEQQFKEEFCPWEHLAICGCHNWGERYTGNVVGKGQACYQLSYNSQFTGQPLTIKNYLAPNINSGQAQKETAWTKEI